MTDPAILPLLNKILLVFGIAMVGATLGELMGDLRMQFMTMLADDAESDAHAHPTIPEAERDHG